mmetsp:Transcript_52041/g.166704  ORF Transcript_52041/g.166704 Transcript_52041/m.166704 type:complete len:140 (-) Transcript_52041:54-473(-)
MASGAQSCDGVCRRLSSVQMKPLDGNSECRGRAGAGAKLERKDFTRESAPGSPQAELDKGFAAEAEAGGARPPAGQPGVTGVVKPSGLQQRRFAAAAPRLTVATHSLRPSGRLVLAAELADFKADGEGGPVWVPGLGWA